MDPKGQFVFFLLAVICFVVSAFWEPELPAGPNPFWRRVNLIALGLALFAFVPLYGAWKAI